MNSNEDIARRLDNREGFSLTSYHDVALPIYRLPITITLQETSEIGAIDEFLLRAIESGVDTVPDLEAFLGLPSSVVVNHLGRLVYELAVGPVRDEQSKYRILAEGNRRLSSAATTTLAYQRIAIYVDGITRKIIPVDPSLLLRGSEAEDLGYSIVSPVSRRRPRPDDLDLASINRLIQSSEIRALPSKGVRAVRVEGFTGRPNLYFQRALALAFKALDGRRISIGFAIDGRQSDEHEVEYERSGAAPKSRIFGPMFDASKRRRGVNAAQRELAQIVAIPEKPAQGRQRLSLNHSRSSRKIESTEIRVLSVYEHPPLLRAALERASKRVVIISPWLRAAVLTNEFTLALTKCLSRGVQFVIAYGIGKSDPKESPADLRAREALEALTASFPNFRLIRKGNTHAKVLLVDSDFFVTTSFNWLSFRGDPSQPMREEEGTMVKNAASVDEYYESLMARLGDGA